MLAFGIAVPELAVTMLSFQRHGIKMAEFGLAAQFGSIAFTTTFVPAMAYFMNYGILKARPECTPEEIKQFSRLRKLFVRDMVFICLGLGLYYIFLENFSIDLIEVAILFAMFIIYITVVYCMQLQQDKQDALES